MSHSLLNQVLLTLAYSDQFNFPLSLQEVHRRLIESKASIKETKTALTELESRGLVKSTPIAKKTVKNGPYWQLVEGKANPKLRQAREKLAEARFSETQQLKKLVSWLPWIRGIAVTGSLAVNNLGADGDIDFMIITSRNRLWLSRLVVGVLTWVIGKRRTWRGHRAESWCFNLWLTDQKMNLPPKKRNLYGAYEICQARFIYDDGLKDSHKNDTNQSVEQLFYQENSWVENWLPNYFQEKQQLSYQEAKNSDKNSYKKNRTSILATLGQWLMTGMEWLAFIFQYLHMYSHMSRELIDFSFAFFHPLQTKKIIYDRLFQTLLLNRGQQKLVLVTGVFDLFHQEHLNFLRKARAAGDILVVGVESNLRVKQLKGFCRPVQNQAVRREQVQALAEVDWAFILPDQFFTTTQHRKLLQELQPDILAVSSHTSHQEEKEDLMDEIGGKLAVVHQYNPEISTSQLIH